MATFDRKVLAKVVAKVANEVCGISERHECD